MKWTMDETSLARVEIVEVRVIIVLLFPLQGLNMLIKDKNIWTLYFPSLTFLGLDPIVSNPFISCHSPPPLPHTDTHPLACSRK